MSGVIITKDNFEEEVLQADLPVLVDFWASWCGPCRMLGPIVDEIAKEYEGKVKVAKVNVDEEMALAQSYQISSIPTLLLFKEGQIVDRSLGYVPKQQIESMLK